jgi:hypothetical protein
VIQGRAGHVGKSAESVASAVLEGLCDCGAQVAELIRDVHRYIDTLADAGTILIPLEVPAGGIGADVDAQIGHG